MNAVFGVIQRIEGFVLAWGMIGIALLTIVNVFTRTLFGLSLAFAEELSQFAIVFVTFVGLSYGASRGRHIRMTAIYDQLPDKAQKAVMLLVTGVTAGLLFALFAFSISYVGTVHTLGTVSPSLQVPLWMVYLAAPLGLGLAGLQYVLAFVRNLVSDGVWLSWTERDAYEDAAPADGI